MNDRLRYVRADVTPQGELEIRAALDSGRIRVVELNDLQMTTLLSVIADALVRRRVREGRQ